MSSAISAEEFSLVRLRAASPGDPRRWSARCADDRRPVQAPRPSWSAPCGGGRPTRVAGTADVVPRRAGRGSRPRRGRRGGAPGFAVGARRRRRAPGRCRGIGAVSAGWVEPHDAAAHRNLHVRGIASTSPATRVAALSAVPPVATAPRSAALPQRGRGPRTRTGCGYPAGVGAAGYPPPTAPCARAARTPCPRGVPPRRDVPPRVRHAPAVPTAATPPRDHRARHVAGRIPLTTPGWPARRLGVPSRRVDAGPWCVRRRSNVCSII